MDEQILSKFGLHIKALRKGKNLSQEQLASLSELDRTYISGIERGKRNVSLLNIIKIAGALELKVSALLEFSWVNDHD
ncbi:MAG: helix-turn-helix transcriptional regulator [Bermanella sp.]